MMQIKQRIMFLVAPLLINVGMQAQTTIKAQSIYDVNQDDKVAVSDVTSVVNRLKAPDGSSTEKTVVDTEKLLEVLNALNARLTRLENSIFDIKVNAGLEHAYVDLGLPSGTLWATCNVGATSPEDYGNYYAWGETIPQSENVYSWASYKWCEGSETTLTKYCIDDNYGSVDNNTELGSSDDAATVNWGDEWQMPSKDQIEELINSKNTASEWTVQNGTSGYVFTSKYNGNTIFLPAAGARYDGALNDATTNGYYCTRTIGYNSISTYALCFSSGKIESRCNSRYAGRSVRPVRVKQN